MSDLVTIKIAKKLKEKGFPQHICDTGYIIKNNEKNRYNIGDKENVWKIPKNLSYIAAPTIGQTFKWLRDKKKIHIESFLYNKKYSYLIKDITQICKDDLFHKCLNEDTTEEEYETYEQSALSAIEYILNNNLI